MSENRSIWVEVTFDFLDEKRPMSRRFYFPEQKEAFAFLVFPEDTTMQAHSEESMTLTVRN